MIACSEILARSGVLLLVIVILCVRVTGDVTLFNARGAEQWFQIPPLVGAFAGLGLTKLIPFASRKTSPITVSCIAMFLTTASAMLIVLAWDQDNASPFAVCGKVAMSTMGKLSGFMIRLPLLSQIVASQPMPLQPSWNDYAFFCLGIGAIVLPAFSTLLQYNSTLAVFALGCLAIATAGVLLSFFRPQPITSRIGRDENVENVGETMDTIPPPSPSLGSRVSRSVGLSILLQQQENNPTYIDPLIKSAQRRVRRLSTDGPITRGQFDARAGSGGEVGFMASWSATFAGERLAIGGLVMFGTVPLQLGTATLAYKIRLSSNVSPGDAASMIVYLFFGAGIGHTVTRWYRPWVTSRKCLIGASPLTRLVFHALAAAVGILPIIISPPTTVWVPCLCASIITAATNVVLGNAYTAVKHTYPSKDGPESVRGVNGPFLVTSIVTNIIGMVVFVLQPDGMWPFATTIGIAVCGTLVTALVQQRIEHKQRTLSDKKRLQAALRAVSSVATRAPPTFVALSDESDTTPCGERMATILTNTLVATLCVVQCIFGIMIMQQLGDRS